MGNIGLKYGRSRIALEYEEARFDVLGSDVGGKPLSDAELGDKLASPIDSPALEDLIEPGQSVLIVVPDATRRTGSGQVINLVVRRLIANGTAPGDIRIIFATGIHRQVTADEKVDIVTAF